MPHGCALGWAKSHERPRPAGKCCETQAHLLSICLGNYDTAKRGSLRVFPADFRLADLKADYQQMQEQNRRSSQYRFVIVEEVADEEICCSISDVYFQYLLFRSIESKPAANKRQSLGKRLDNLPFHINAIARISGGVSHNR